MVFPVYIYIYPIFFFFGSCLLTFYDELQVSGSRRESPRSKSLLRAQPWADSPLVPTDRFEQGATAADEPCEPFEMPSGYVKIADIAIENGHRNSEFTH